MLKVPAMNHIDNSARTRPKSTVRVSFRQGLEMARRRHRVCTGTDGRVAARALLCAACLFVAPAAVGCSEHDFMSSSMPLPHSARGPREMMERENPLVSPDAGQGRAAPPAPLESNCGVRSEEGEAASIAVPASTPSLIAREDEVGEPLVAAPQFPTTTPGRAYEQDTASLQRQGHEIAGGPVRDIGMADLQQNAELRRFATFSEEQLRPLELPALHWLANATLAPLRERVDNALQGLANQPEVLVWSLQPGDHLRVKGVAGFMALTHHAIYLGNGRIMHFTGGITDKVNASVRIDTLSRLHRFTQSIGHTACRIEVVPHPPNALPRDKIVERAISREGEMGYNLFSKNCEHVVLWCISGEEQSLQVAGGHRVDRLTKDPIGLGMRILREQADAGAPVNVNEVCRTLLPPSIVTPLLKVHECQQQAADAAREFISKTTLPRLPWQRDESWLDGVRRRILEVVSKAEARPG